ncbi:MAG: S-layer family protein, partial [Bacteroidetes bacterium]|nr:S-layer family protein [Bacteroidota bacterium]
MDLICITLGNHHRLYVIPYKLLLAAFLALSFQFSFGQGNFNSAATGNWNAAGSWTLVSGVDGDGVPDANDNVTILNGHNITVNVASNVNTFIINSGGTITATNALTATTPPNTVNSGGTYIHNQNGGTIPTATWGATSTCSITGATNTFPAAGFGQTFGHLIWNCVQTAGLTFNATPVIAGDFSIQNTNGQQLRVTNSAAIRTINVTGNYNHSGNSVFIIVNSTGAGTLNVGGNFNLTAGTFTLKTNTGAAALNVTGNFSESGTANFNTRSNATSTAAATVTGNFSWSGTGTYSLCTIAGATGNLNVGGNFTHTTGTVSAAAGTGSITFNGAGTQTFTSGGTLSGGINFTVNSGATLQMAAAGTVISSGSSGTFTLSSGATLGVTSANGITTAGATGNIQVTGTRTYTAGANYIYNGTGNQAVGNGLTQNTPNNVTINNPGNTVSLGTSTSIGGTLIITAGTFDANTQTNTITGLTTGNGTYLASTALQTFNGGLTISGGTFTGSTGAVTTTDVTFSSGTLTAPSGVFNVSGNWSKTGGTFTPGLNTVTFTKAAGTQTLNSGGSSFNNISHTGAGTLQLSVSALTTAGTFTNASGTFDANTLAHTVTGLATLSAGSYLPSIALQTFNGGLTISGGTFAGSTGAVTAGDVTLNSGTLTAPSGIFSVSGNWLETGGTFTPGSNTVTFTKAAGTQTLNSGGVSFNNISHTGAGTLQLSVSALTTAGTFSNSSGTFDANALTHTVTGLTTLSGGSYLASTSLQSFDGGLTISGAAFTGSTGAVTTTDVNVTSGTLTAPSGVFSVSGNWSKTGGAFAPAANTVTFIKAAGTQTINSVGTSFNNISHTGAGTLQLFTSALTVGGTFTNSSGSFDANGLASTVTGLTTVSGGSYLASTAVQTFNGGLTVSGGGSFSGSSGTISVNGNLSIGDGSALSIAGSDFTVTGLTQIGGGASGNLSITSSTGTKTFEGLITLSAGATWNNSGNSDVIFRGGISRSGGTFTAGSGVHTFNTNSQSLTGTFSIPNVTVTGISLTNNNSLTVTNALIGTGNFTQAPNATLVITGSSAVSSINASNSGNSVTFNGSSQTINTGTYHDLIIAQSSGDALLAGSTTVNGTLTLSAGNIDIGSNDLTIGSSGAISGATSAKRIIASSTGKLIKVLTSINSLFTFPIGDNTFYSPVDVTVTSGSIGATYSLSASVADAKHSSNVSAVNYLTRYWNITQTGVTSCIASITGTYDIASDVVGTETSIKAAQLSGAFNQTSNPWVKFSALGASTLNATGASLTSGLTSVFTGITGANPSASITGGGVSICSGNSVALGTTASGDPTLIYSWSPSTGLSATNVPNPTASPTSTTVYTVTVTDGNGITNTDNTTITVSSPPAAPSVSFPVNSYCIGATITPPTATGTALQWYSDAGLTSTLSTVDPANPTAAELGFSSASAGSTTVYITQTTGGCRSTATVVTLTIFSSFTASIVSDDADNTICAGTNVRFTATPSGGANYDFRVNGGSVQNGASNIYNSATLANADQVDVIVTVSGGCSGTSSAITMTVVASPTVNDPSDIVICTGATTAAINFTGTGTSYTWTNNNTTIGLAASGVGDITPFVVSNPGTSPLVATVVVTPNNATCSGTTQNFTITVNPTPTSSNPGDQEYCNGAATGAISFSGTATSFDWTNSDASIGLAASGTGNISFTATNPGVSSVVATIVVTPKYGTCSGGTQTFTITVDPTPSVGAVSNQAVCHGAAVAAINFAGTATSFDWTNSDATIGLSASGSGNIASFAGFNAGAASKIATIQVTPSYGTCTGSPQSFTITVDPLPTVSNAGLDQDQCNNGSFTLAGNNPTVGSGLWTIVGAPNGAVITTPGSNNSTVTGLIAGSSVTLRWTISSGVCTPSTDDVVLTNYSSAAPSGLIAGSDIVQCNNGSFTLAGSAATTGTGLWSVVSGAVTITTPTSNTSTVTGLAAGNSATLRWTITNGS